MKAAPKAQSKKEIKPELTGKSLQEVVGLFCVDRFRGQKKKIEQMALDFAASLEHHRQTSVEVDLFYRFFTFIYTD